MPEFPAVIALSSLNGANGFRLDGVAAGDVSGRSGLYVGDINGDGFDDVIVSSGGADPNGTDSGSSYVIFGKAGGFASSLNLSNLNGTNGFRIDGVAADDRSGSFISSAGDVNGDGFDDVIVGAFGSDVNGTDSGSSYVVFGKAGGFASSLNLSSLNGTNGFRLDGVAADDNSGTTVSSAGDLNGDGFDDLIIGADGADPGLYNAGACYVVFGKAGGFASAINLSSLNGTNGFRLTGASAEDYLGKSVSSAGDVNGDGFDDLIVGAFRADPNGTDSGSSYIVFGKADGFESSLSLSNLYGTNGFRLDGVAEDDRSGFSVSSAGDVNADGFDDVIVGAWRTDHNGNNSGSSYVVFGKAGGFASSLNLSSLDGTNGFRLDGAAAGDGSGISVSAAGDVNGDGFEDVIIGAFGAAPNGVFSGSSYVAFGKAGGFASAIDLSSLNGTNGFRLDGEAAGDNSGLSVAAAGDVNGDGFDDLIVGAPATDQNGTSSGASYVIFGRAPDSAVTRAGTNADNTISGGAFGDTLIGNAGSDLLRGGAGKDFLYGDGRPAGVGSGTGFVTKASGAGNTTLASAIDVSNAFSLAADTDIIDPTKTPHVTISGTGDGNRDYYKVFVNSGSTLILDIDNTSSNIDSLIMLYDANGILLALNDDNPITDGAGGSTRVADSFLTYTVAATGYYYVEVGDYLGQTINEPIAAGATYELQISAADSAGVGGGSGDDTLDGGTGADIMTGGAGSDTYYVDNAGDRAVEANGDAGTDLVIASISYSLAGYHLENLTLTGTGNLNATGNSLANTLTGNAGANILDGAGGADRMIGGAGSDTYYVDNAGDRAVELNGDAGTDHVIASVSYSLAGYHLENLTLTGSGNLNGTGNSLANTLTGNAGANILDGGSGADRMVGGEGSDTYYVDNAGDRPVEFNGASGTDHVISSVSYSLAGYELENLTLTGTGNLNGTGNGIANTIRGNSGANILNGLGGSDTLYGLGGNDTFLFDTTLGGGNIDHIGDFSSADDTIRLDQSIFAALGLGTLSASAYKDIGDPGALVDSNDRILYNDDTGALYYDADGSGATARIQFAILDTKPATLTNADFFVVA